VTESTDRSPPDGDRSCGNFCPGRLDRIASSPSPGFGVPPALLGQLITPKMLARATVQGWIGTLRDVLLFTAMPRRLPVTVAREGGAKCSRHEKVRATVVPGFIPSAPGEIRTPDLRFRRSPFAGLLPQVGAFQRSYREVVATQNC
jgi:hypothetical protein